MAQLAGDFQPCTGALSRQFPLHLGQADHEVKEELARGCSCVHGVGKTLEMHALLVQLADQVH